MAICLNRDTGKEIWTKQLEAYPNSEESSIFQISLNKYKQLDSSIILMFSDNKIELIDSITGNTLIVYNSENRIDYLRDFDIFDKCIYFVESNKISKLIFKVKS